MPLPSEKTARQRKKAQKALNNVAIKRRRTLVHKDNVVLFTGVLLVIAALFIGFQVFWLPMTTNPVENTGNNTLAAVCFGAALLVAVLTVYTVVVLAIQNNTPTYKRNKT